MLDSKQKTSSETADLRGGLEAADPTTLLLALVQLTGEGTGLRKPSPYIRGPMNYQEFMADQLRASIGDRLTEVLAERDRAGKTSYQPPDDALLREMMSAATGEAVPDDYIAMTREDLTADSLQSRSLK
jgi:hypothetical protein